MTQSQAVETANPLADCPYCPRLVEFRQNCQREFPDWFNAPVPNWGDESPQLLIVGLAPGLRGANRTGRPFTGDYAGDLLYATLAKAGVTSGTYAESADDDLKLHGVMITNAVRCVPPQNRPTGPEIKACASFLDATLKGPAQTVLALGQIAHNSVLRSFGAKLSAHKFAHEAKHILPDGRVLFDSYHCSRYNTNTNRLTTEMFESVVFAACAHAGLRK